MVEIILCFFIATLEDLADWPLYLPQIQSVINNSTSAVGRAPNEICYSFTPNFTIDFTMDPELRADLPRARVSATDALDFATINMKHNYDHKHTAIFFTVGNWALLWLHCGYSIPSATNCKLHQ